MRGSKPPADLKTPARDRLTGVGISPEEFREALLAAFDDPAFARAVANRLALPALPVRGGACAGPSAADITSGNFGSNCSDTGNYNFGGGGKVGIGTTSPLDKLHVDFGGSSGFVYAVSSVSGTWGYKIRSSYGAGSDVAVFTATGNTGELRIGAVYSTYYPTFYSGNAEAMRITTNGNVGIGTTSPLGKLHVDFGSSSGFIYAVASGAGPWGYKLHTPFGGGEDVGVFSAYGNGELRIGAVKSTYYPTFYSGNAERMRITAGGNVGIGTTSPIRPLHVKGGDIVVEGDPVNGGGLAMMKPNASETTSVLYRAGGSDEGQDITILRTYRNAAYSEGEYTILNVLAPPETQTFPTASREAALTLERADESGHSEFLDLYNNYYPTSPNPEKQFGIRIQKRNPSGDSNAQYRDFVIDQALSTNNFDKHLITILRATRKVGVGTRTTPAKLTVQGESFTATRTGSITGSGTMVTGVGTIFTQEVDVGDLVTISGQNAVVTVVNSDTQLTVTSPGFSGSPSGDMTITNQLLQVNDASGNVKIFASSQGNVGIGTAAPSLQLQVSQAMAAGVNDVAFSATPTFDASLGNTQMITLTNNVTSSALANAVAGQWLVFDIVEDGAGGRSFQWPGNFKGAGSINTGANKHNVQVFYFDGSDAWAVGPIQSN